MLKDSAINNFSKNWIFTIDDRERYILIKNIEVY